MAHLDDQYGKQDTECSAQYEEELETFKLGVIIQELFWGAAVTWFCVYLQA